MLFDVRRYASAELDAVQEIVDIRVTCLRVTFFRGRNVANDYRLLEHASPFVHRLLRPQLTILLEGHGRFEEDDRRSFFDGGTLVASSPSRHATEAYAGTPCEWMAMTWDPSVLGAPLDGAYEIVPLDARDHERLHAAAKRLESVRPADAMAELLAILRAMGVPFAGATADDLLAHAPADDMTRLQAAVAASLTSLDRHPSIDDVAASLGWNARLVHRRLTAIADAYMLPWTHWREALHQTRLHHAMRLLSARGATTELVARLAGFRAPTALCHAFAKAGLPSPGTLARAAERDVLDAWCGLVQTRAPRHAA